MYNTDDPEGGDVVSLQHKECTLCKTVKALTEFSKDAGAPDGYCYNCKVCRSKASRQYRKSNVDRVREYNKAYGKSHNNKINHTAAIPVNTELEESTAKVKIIITPKVNEEVKVKQKIVITPISKIGSNSDKISANIPDLNRKKICSNCKLSKPICEFNKNKDRSDGLQYECKVCTQERSARYRQTHKAEASAYGKEYRAKNPEKIKAYNTVSDEEKQQNNDQRKEYYWNDMRKYAEKHEGQLLTSASEYKDAHTNLQFQCKNGHKFLQTLNNALKNRWCPDCSCRYVRELHCKYILETLTGKTFTKIRPSWLTIGTSRLELDMYNDELKLALEHNGEQHYEQIDFFGNHERFFTQQTYDMLKNKLCYEKGVTLLTVPYSVKDYLLRDHIKDLLKENNIPIVEKDDEDGDTSFMTEKYKSDMLDSIVKNKQGELLSGVPLANKSILVLKCKEGHEWTTNWGKIRSGSWCHHCAHYRDEATRSKISSGVKAFNDTDNGKAIKAESHEKRSVTMSLKRAEIRANITEKKCRGSCGLIKPISEFGSKSAAADGLQPYCRPCQSIAKKEWRNKKKQ